MSNGNGSNGASLAVAEKRHCNNGGGGGCAGILFQLFDWHRRFAKKKLFKRRLLPYHYRSKQAVHNFKEDEKMPAAKLNLIADYNDGRRPSTGKNRSRNLDAEQKHGTQAPGLVARLMGLESMPFVQQKLRKNYQCRTKQEKVVRGSRDLGEEDINVEKGVTKHGSMPPTLPKTDRRVVTQLGEEDFQVEDFFTRPMKHHHQKLPTPVRSPRIIPSNHSSSLTSSRLIDAATKMLEHGLQNKNRIKCDLPYSSIVQQASTGMLMQGQQFLSSVMPRQNPGSEFLATKPSTRQSSCRNWGNLHEDSLNGKRIMLEQKLNHFDIATRQLDDLYHSPVALVVPSKGDSLAEHHYDRQVKDFKACKEYQDGWPLSKHKSKAHSDEMPSQERSIPNSGNSYPKGGRVLCSMGVVNDNKDFVNIIGSMNSITRLKIPARAKSQRDVRRSGSTYRMTPPLQKMRSSCEHPNSASASHTKQKSRSGSSGGGNSSRCIENSDGIVSFTFHSHITDTAGFPDEVKNNEQDQHGFNEKNCLESKSRMSQNYLPQLQRKRFALSGDDLGAILEEKLKELTSQDEEEDIISCEMPRRPTTVILQELIAAITTKPSVLENSVVAESKTDFQMQRSLWDAPESFPNVNSFSPGSVLKSSFSNDSCASSSFDDTSDMQLMDSTTSSQSNMGSTHFVELTSLIDRLAGIMDSLILADVRLAGSKVKLSEDILLHAELVFASFTPEKFKYLEDVICFLLQDVFTELKSLFSLGDAKMGSEMKVFSLDCLLECFDKGYRRCCNIGYKGWERQLSSSPETLSRDIVEKVQGWAGLSGLTSDEIIENEMNLSLGKWTDFDIEAFELGASFADDVLKDVVEEIVVSTLCTAH